MKSFAELGGGVKECHVQVLVDENWETVLIYQNVNKSLSLGFKDVRWIIDKGYIEIYGFNKWSLNFVKEEVKEITDDIICTQVTYETSEI